MYNTTTLSNGTKLVTYSEKNLETVAMMVLIKTGTMFEQNGEEGIAHFLEHMCFKDTKNFKKEDLMLEFEKRGVQTNAFTSFECTAYYAKTTKDLYPEVLPLVSELYHHPLFKEEDIKIEQGVVIGEINMYKDDPMMCASDAHDECMYGKGKPHGASILGTVESVSAINSDMLIDFHNRFYIPENTTIMIAGNFNEDTIASLCEQYFSSKKTDTVLDIPKTHITKGPLVNHVVKESEQTHIVCSFTAVSFFDPQTTLLELTALILGQGFTSRLFKRLREKMGAGYYVVAKLDQTFDSGAIIIRTGTDHTRVKEILAAIKEECDILKQEPVSDEELKKAKDMTIARFVMGLESSDSLAEYHGVRAVLGLPLRNSEIIKDELSRITPEDVLKCAQTYFVDEGFLVTVVGPQLLDEQLIEYRRELHI